MRRARVTSNTGIYHLTARGNGKQEIFLDEIDNRYFLKLIIEAKNRHDTEIYAYCIMGNHYHLLVESRNIADFCKEINQTYAHYYNAKNKTVGHVFQGRYKSFAVENEEYLTCVLRYIHNNPVKAGIVENPGDYPWSSYHEYLSGEGLSSIYPILNIFDKGLRQARRRFVSFSNQEDGFDYETANSSELFSEYIRGKSIVEELRGERAELEIDELKEIRKRLKEETSLSDKNIIGILGIGKTKYYKKINEAN